MRDFSRRRFCGVLASPVLLFATRAPAWAESMPRELRFLHTHTGERLTVDCLGDGTYPPESLQAVDHFLRDYRTGEVRAIDPELLRQLRQLARATRSAQPFEVICGYRSPATNEMLRHRGGGVALNSLHLEGRAVDIRLADVPLAAVRQAALDARAGGVGYYPASNFVHIDTGRFRAW